MIRQLHLTKNDSEDIAFASSCLVVGAITFEEFKRWLEWIVENHDEYPSYVFDILDIKEKFEYLRSRLRVHGFMPAWRASKAEEIAVHGLCYKRFADFHSDMVPRWRRTHR